ncbi:hypothetical protein PAMC26577_13430 [Caballeronia sordidicola]|uniref:Uncharacterized protein n=1 Tax=Caballeronia sordidicola TaxID=196367 RepID=A0A242MV08_CABSO|nr:hypothetical protein PAMC26577_13430 [Caballeronia sordidicola]
MDKPEVSDYRMGKTDSGWSAFLTMHGYVAYFSIGWPP